MINLRADKWAISGPHFYWITFAVIAISLLGNSFLEVVGYQSLALIYILTLMIFSLFLSPTALIYGALLSALIWDYFFIPPVGMMTISSTEDIILVILFTVVAITGGMLTYRLNQQKKAISKTADHRKALLDFANEATDINDPIKIFDLLADQIEWLWDVNVRFNSDVLAKLTSATEEVHLHIVETEDSWQINLNKNSTTDILLKFEKPTVLFDRVELQEFIDYTQFIYTDQRARVIERERALLAEVTKLQKTIIDLVSHELKTPVTTLIGSSSTLMDMVGQGNNSHEMQDLLLDIRKSATHLNDSIQGLIDASRIESGRMTLNKEWFELDELIDQLHSDLQNEIPDKSFKVSMPLDFVITGDFVLLKNGLLNLLRNAFQSENKTVELKVNQQNHEIQIAIISRGSVVPLELRQKLFERFSKSNYSNGLGLGLWITKNIAELHGGTLRYQNLEEEPGSIFLFSLPQTLAPEFLNSETVNPP